MEEYRKVAEDAFSDSVWSLAPVQRINCDRGVSEASRQLRNCLCRWRIVGQKMNDAEESLVRKKEVVDCIHKKQCRKKAS